VCRTLKRGGDALRLEMQAGLIEVRAQADRWTLTAPTPTWRELEVSTASLARALNLEERDIGARPLWVKAGKEQLIVPLTSEDAVRRASPQRALSEIQSADGRCMAYVFAPRGSAHALARFFFPQDAMFLEDPATGSATANLGGWCLAMGRPLPVKLKIDQGEFVGRPSSLYLEVNSEGNIFVGGDVIEIGRGTVSLV
jgi:PhzF family phenazine biosynthesis protein